MAEAVFKHELQSRGLTGWKVDSAGIQDWHHGRPPNKRTLQVMQKYRIPIDHYARQVTKEDFFNYDIIFGMDIYNMRDLELLAPKTSHVRLEPFGSYDPLKELNIKDPFCDIGIEGFEKCYAQCRRCTIGFLDKHCIMPVSC